MADEIDPMASVMVGRTAYPASKRAAVAVEEVWRLGVSVEC
jgi:hypothetical protein